MAEGKTEEKKRIEDDDYGDEGAEPVFPVTKVVLSKHGVGYFERRGKVPAGSSFELFFKKKDMNDVLKSLTMVDVEGSLVSSISYESTKPAQEQLDGLSLKLDDHSALRDLLIQLKGTEIALEVVDEKTGKPKKVDGLVVGLEESYAQNPHYRRYFISVLVGGLSVQFFDLAKVTNLVLNSELMQHELRHLLRIVLQTKKKDEKSITAYTPKASSESMTRNIHASYILEAPIWKTSFRLLLSTTKKGKSLFQAWALVDNTQNEDWKGVDLYLTSGAQHSFIYDLYNPRQVQRQKVEVKQEETMGPVQIEDSVAQHSAATLAAADVMNIPLAPPMSVASFSSAAMTGAAPPPPAFSGPPMAPMSSSMSRSAPARPASAPKAMMSMRKKDSRQKEERAFGGKGGGGMRMSRARSDMEEEEDMSYGSISESKSSAPSYDLQSEIGADLLEVEKEEAPPPEPEASYDPFVAYDKLQAAASVEVKTETKDRDSAFQCKISTPVNIKRNQSALVPFLQSEFKGEKVAVYNKNVRISNPLSVIKFPNTFGVPLEEGPLSIYEDDVYVGEAMLPSLKPGSREDQSIYLAYSVELKCNITQEADSEQRKSYRVQFHDRKKKTLETPIWINRYGKHAYHGHVAFSFPHQLHFSDTSYAEYWPPAVTFYHWRVFSATYIIDNKKKQEMKLYLEHPRRLDCELIETPEPSTQTDHFYRFVLDIKAESVVKFVVKERRAEDRTVELNAITELDLMDWEKKSYVEEKTLAKLRELVKANLARKQLTTEFEHANSYQNTISDELRRIREADVAIHQITTLIQKQEKDLHTRQEQEEDLEKKVKQRKEELKEFEAKNPKDKMKEPAKAPTYGTPKTAPKKSPEEEAWEEHKKLIQRLTQDETRYNQLKKQNEDDTKLINDLNAALTTHKADVKVQVKGWETSMEEAKNKADVVRAQVLSNKNTIDTVIQDAIKMGGDRFLGPESERPKEPKPEIEKDKITALFSK